MNERDKIINIMQSVRYCKPDSGCGGCKYDAELDNYSYVSCRTLRIADALIEAGIGDVNEEKSKAFVYANEIAYLDNQLKEYKHRAEVAERALLTACVNLIKDEEDNVNLELLAHVVYTKFLRKAEKELAEEKNEKNRNCPNKGMCWAM